MQDSAKPSDCRVTEGNSHLTIYPWTHPATGSKRWRSAFQDAGKWKYRTFKTKVADEHAAGRILEEAPAGLVWTGLDLDLDTRKFLEEIHRRTPVADRPAPSATSTRFPRKWATPSPCSTAITTTRSPSNSATSGSPPPSV